MFGSSPPGGAPRSGRRSTSPFAPGAGAKPAPPAPSVRDLPPAPKTARERPPRRGGRAPEPSPEELEEEIPFVPVRRLLALTIGGFAALLGVGLIMGAQTSGVAQRLPFAIVVFGAQVLYVLATSMALRPPNGKLVAAVAIACAVAGAYFATESATGIAGLTRIALVSAAGFGVGALGQLMWREGRVRISESFGATAVVVLGTAAYSVFLVLVRYPLGGQTIVICLSGAAVALSVARFADTVIPLPRMAPQVPRGAVGVVLGAMLGTLTTTYIGSYLAGYKPENAALVGGLAAIVAIAVDLTIGFAEAGRELEGDPPTMWLARHMQGPLAGFAIVAPVAYLLNAWMWTGS